jgi:DNA-binding NtrC family response regulator
MDEIAEMPLGTQARLLRVLEAGEFIRVGSSKVQKTDVRVIAASNKDLLIATQNGKFREDLYYRLNTVPIRVPSLRERKEDIILLFRKFAVDFAEKYKAAPIQLDEEAKNLLINYAWPGNVRELKNIAEQISVLSQEKMLAANDIRKFLPEHSGTRLPMIMNQKSNGQQGEYMNERDILYKLFFDMKKDVNELKKMFLDMLQNPSSASTMLAHDSFLRETSADTMDMEQPMLKPILPASPQTMYMNDNIIQEHVEVDESLNIMDKEKELIEKALKKHKGKRKDAASDLGISERTLYRKLKEYNIEE